MNFLLHHTLRASAERFPNKTALVHESRRLTYHELQTRVQAFAGVLIEAGVCRGDRVGIFMEPCVEQVESIYAVSQAQGVFVPIHHSLKADQVSHIANDCGIRILVTTAEQLHQLHDVLEQTPSLIAVVATGEAAEISSAVQILNYEEKLDAAAETPISEAAIDRDLCAILYTSGSTGKPKGVMLSHANMVAGASIVSDYLSITHNDRLLAALPFSFDAGLNQLTTSVQQGGTLVLINFRFAREIVKVLARERITGLGGVPPLWNLLVQKNSSLAKTDLPSLRYITNTGGAMPQKTLTALRAGLPETKVFLMYGLTEAFRTTYLPPEELDRRPTSMGKAIPNTEILVLNESGQPCDPDEPGELVHHGPTVCLGYWGHQELTDKVLRPHPFPPPGTSGDSMKVVYSGDVVRKDTDGFLYFVGRRDNLIKSSGFRVSPNEVEDAIFQTGLVREAAVVGVADEMLGQSITAFIVPAEGKEVSASDVLTKTATLLPRHMVPKTVEIRPVLPKTSSGKTNYSALRQDAARRVVAETVEQNL